VALGSLAFVLWLFFTNTVPALHENEALDQHERELAKLRADYDAAIQEARLGTGPNAHFDLQALLVAIDQRNLTPAELCMLHPERAEVAPHLPSAEPEPDATPPEPGTSR
jgi:hypothetical protein